MVDKKQPYNTKVFEEGRMQLKRVLKDIILNFVQRSAGNILARLSQMPLPSYRGLSLAVVFLVPFALQ